MKILNRKIVSKKYAVKAALYRRLARKSGMSLDYSLDALLELHDFESRGVGDSFSVIKKTNGYAYGKWLRDIDVAQITEGISSGDFCKAEFLSTPIERLHNKTFLATIPSPVWFPYSDRNYIKGLMNAM